MSQMYAEQTIFFFFILKHQVCHFGLEILVLQMESDANCVSLTF